MRLPNKRPQFFGLLRVRTSPDGHLTPLSYGVGDENDFDHATTVGGEYTIAFCGLPHASTRELAAQHLNEGLRWFEPLLRGASPDVWFAAEVGDSNP